MCLLCGDRLDEAAGVARAFVRELRAGDGSSFSKATARDASGRFTSGGLTVVHDKTVDAATARDAVAPVLADPKLMAFLEQHPLKVLLGHDATGSGQRGHGNYQVGRHIRGLGDVPSTVRANVGAEAPRPRPGYVTARNSFPSTGSTPLEVNQRTVLHEVGHHVHAQTLGGGAYGGSSLTYEQRAEAHGPTRDAFAAPGRKVSEYAGKSPAENFAENFAAHHALGPEAHARVEPAGAALIRAHRAEHGY